MQNTDIPKFAAQLGTDFTVVFRQAIVQFKTLNQFKMLEPSRVQVFLNFLRLLEGSIIGINDLAQGNLTVGIGG
ncbi:hypothetical protein EK599_05275 [Vibrio sp. T187]|uniref:hypothetical protein n=1 Tax=Vibrio TaxID=662 RepID=UPI0010C964BF|nr:MULTISPECIES: hypothetical protein [Vibrio]MBW3695092.1 hypothetical protein [Vibrio sp. T187]